VTTHPITGHLRPRTFLSLFAGVGGFDLALIRLGMRCVGQVELDPTARGVLARHFPETPRHDDIHTTIAWWHATPRRPQVDLICAGWPCQDLSQAGRCAGLAGPRSGLFFELARVIDALRPGWLLLENVPGLLDSNRGADFQTVLDTLVQLGYGVSWRVLDARHFGVAQRRRRVWLVGRRGALCPFEVLFEPAGSHRDPAPRRPSRPPAATTPTPGAATAGGAPPAGRDREADSNLLAATLTANYGDGSPRGDASTNLLVTPGPDCPQVATTLPAGQAGQRTTDLNTPLVAAHAHGGGRVWSLSENQRGELLCATVAANLMVGGGKPGQGYPAVLIAPQTPSTLDDAEPPPAVRDDDATSTGTIHGDPEGHGPTVAVSGTLTTRVGKGPSSTGDDGALVLQPTATNPPRLDLAGPPTTRSACRSKLAGQGKPLAVMVRRLTPTECERLQGFPDRWTATDASGRRLSDTARYRLMGNAATVAVVAWVACRLQATHHASPDPPVRGHGAVDRATSAGEVAARG
jgi:DNA (cytosine-5)-methyltransferase 1